MYRDTVERLVPYAVSNGITKFARLEAKRYREVRPLHPQLPSHAPTPLARTPPGGPTPSSG
jgi:hypothetical protein